MQLYNASNVKAISGNTVSTRTTVKITSLINGVKPFKILLHFSHNITELKFEGTGIP